MVIRALYERRWDVAPSSVCLGTVVNPEALVLELRDLFVGFRGRDVWIEERFRVFGLDGYNSPLVLRLEC